MRRTVEALIAEERNKQHHVLAERLEEAFRTNGFSKMHPLASEDVRPGVDVIEPRRDFASLLLEPSVERASRELVEEQQRGEVLRSHGLEPRHRVLLLGSPGNGKTSLAEAIAEALIVPLVRVQYETVVASFLGETAARLARVFDFARTRPCVLFFDEFDVLGKERGDEHETGEIKRVVSSLLLQVDALPSYVVVIGASNHPELLDRAAGRRFQLHLVLRKPDAGQRREWFRRFFNSLEYTRPPRSVEQLARATAGASFSELEDLTLDVRRRLVLDPGSDVSEVLADRLKLWKAFVQTPHA
jgi:SpoVK/Ycf46/Vps4 family AAA+-type ATPase